MIWQLQEAKARFSEVIKKAQSEGPQHITVRGTSTAVVLSDAEYDNS
jgi:antitoxin Phd